MLRRICMELEGKELDYRKSSNLQGVLFEHISTGYSEKMHMQQLHPYSQYLIKEKERLYWYVNTLDGEAAAEIIDVLAGEAFQTFSLKKSDTDVRIIGKRMEQCTQKELLEEFYTKEAEKYFRLEFLTPTAFKQRGRFVIWPDVCLVYQSLMNKYSAILSETDMYDEETLEQLVESSELAEYRLRSVKFPMEGIVIPAFCGTITIRMRGTNTMARYLRMLLRFVEYSGVGIKTAMGMGAVRMAERGMRK